MGGVTVTEVRELKVGRYILIDDEPCKIVDYHTSKPGKHGEAKARIVAVGVFDGVKKSIVHPVKHKVKVPMIDKRAAQVLSMTDAEVQLMDSESYETFNMPIPDEYRDSLEPGQEVQYLDAMGRRMLTRV